MEREQLEQGWREGFAGAAAAMAEWRRQHPRATLREIEDAVDERMAAVRGQMLVDTVLTSEAANFAGAAGRQRPRCPACGGGLVSRGQAERSLLTTQGQELRLGRSYDCAGAMARAPRVGRSFSPLDKELGLLPLRFTPRLVEQIARLGTACVSFDEAQALLRDLLGVEVTSHTVRRITEQAGRKALAFETAQASRLQESLASPVVEVVDRLQQVSVDGAMVPLVGGVFEEVKCVAIGRVEPTAEGPKARALTYFARLGDVDQFIAQAGIEFCARGTKRAREVVAVNDGAEWIQRVLDEHCPTALRIIDWTHAANYIRESGQALLGFGTADGVVWIRSQLDLLWAGRVEAVVAELMRLEDDSERLKPVREARHYLEKRVEMLQYAAFRAAGYPIGSGIVESANKVVVEARLKGAGKHWAKTNVNPMLTLRCANASGRWQQRWRDIDRALRRPHRRRLPPTPTPAPAPTSAQPPPVPGARYLKTFQDGKPTPAHPWKRWPAVHAKT